MRIEASFIAAACVIMGSAGCASAPPHVPAGPPVPVRFVAPDESSQYEVKVKPEGAEEQKCKVPCTLTVASGSAMLSVAGPRTYVQPVVVPAEPSRGELRERRRLQAILGYGSALVFTAAGSIALVVTKDSSPSGQLAGGIVGASMGGLGLVGLIVGLTAGTDQVVMKPDASPPRASRPAVELRGIGLAPQAGGAVGGATISF